MAEKQEMTYNRAKVWQIGLFTLNNAATNTALFLMGYYAYFTQNILGLAAVVVGGIATAMRVFDGITDPLIGYMLDKTNTKFGRFRPYMILGTLIMCTCLLAIFHAPQGMSTTGAYIYTTVLYTIYILGYTCQTTVTKAAQAVITNDPKQRPLYSGFDGLFTRLSGAFISVLLTMVLADRYAVGEYQGKGMLNPALWGTASKLCCLFMVTLTGLAVIGIWKKDRSEFYVRSSAAVKVKFSDYVDIIGHNRPIQMLMISAATDKLATMLMSGLLVYMCSNLLMNTSLQGKYTIASLIPVMVAAFVGVGISRKVGLKKNFLIGTWGSAAMLVVLFLLKPDPANPWLWLGLYIVQNCIACLANGSVVPMLADCADYEAYRSGRFVPGMIGTIFSFVDKLLSSVSYMQRQRSRGNCGRNERDSDPCCLLCRLAQGLGGAADGKRNIRRGGVGMKDRPYIFCHMMTSLDGKIMGNYMDTPEGEAAGNVFYDIAFGKSPYYKHQGWLSGRVTTDDNFTFYEKPELNETAPAVPEGDFVAQKTDMYYVSIDPSGKLGWKSNTLTYGDTTAHVLEVLTGKASSAYKAFLRKLGISYIIAGENALDYQLAMEKLKTLFGIETLMLGGGAALNWSFLQAGMCDEISVVIAAAADGSPTTQTLFMAREGLSDDTPIGFALQEAKVMDGGSVWLRYLVKQKEG